MTFLRTIVFLLFAALAVWLALANRDVVPFSLSPLPFQIDAPLYALLFGALSIGMVIGSFAAWRAGLRRQKKARLKRPLPPPVEETKTVPELAIANVETVPEQKVLP